MKRKGWTWIAAAGLGVAGLVGWRLASGANPSAALAPVQVGASASPALTQLAAPAAATIANAAAPAIVEGPAGMLVTGRVVDRGDRTLAGAHVFVAGPILDAAGAERTEPLD